MIMGFQRPALRSGMIEHAHSLSKQKHQAVPAQARDSFPLCPAVLHTCNTAYAAGSHGHLCTETQCQFSVQHAWLQQHGGLGCTLSSLAVLILSSSLCTRLPSGASVVRSLCVEVLSWPLNSRHTSHGCSVYLDSDKAVMGTQQPRTEFCTRNHLTCSLPFLRSSLRRLTPSAEGVQAVAKHMAAIALLLPTGTGQRLRRLLIPWWYVLNLLACSIWPNKARQTRAQPCDPAAFIALEGLNGDC